MFCIEKLDRARHDRNSFISTNPSFDDYLKKFNKPLIINSESKDVLNKNKLAVYLNNWVDIERSIPLMPAW